MSSLIITAAYRCSSTYVKAKCGYLLKPNFLSNLRTEILSKIWPKQKLLEPTASSSHSGGQLSNTNCAMSPALSLGEKRYSCSATQRVTSFPNQSCAATQCVTSFSGREEILLRCHSFSNQFVLSHTMGYKLCRARRDTPAMPQLFQSIRAQPHNGLQAL